MSPGKNYRMTATLDLNQADAITDSFSMYAHVHNVSGLDNAVGFYHREYQVISRSGEFSLNVTQMSHTH